MAAPSGTSWGSISGSGNYQGRIGLYVTSSSSNTQTTVTVQVWYWSRYAVSDSSNTFYFDWDSYADNSIGSRSISTPNTNWGSGSQVHIGTYSATFNRATYAQTGYASARFTGIEYGGGSGYNHYVSYSIQALPSYSVSYNANGGSGAPSAQVKIYNHALTLSNVRPTRTGYNFLGWSTDSSSTVAQYSPSGTLPASVNYNVVFYAVWQRNSYSVTFDAGTNGGTVMGGVSYTRTVLYNQMVGELPEAERKNYKLIGWNTDPNGNGLQIADDMIIRESFTVYAVFELQANCYVKDNGTYKTGMMYIKDNGVYRTGTVKVKDNGIYKDTNM